MEPVVDAGSKAANEVRSWCSPCTWPLSIAFGWLANPRWTGYHVRAEYPKEPDTVKELNVYGAMHWACELLTFAALFVNIDSISLSPAPNVYYNPYPGSAQYDLAGLCCMAIAAFGKWFFCFWAHNVSFLWWAIWYAAGWYTLMFSPYSPSKGLMCSGGNSTCLNAFNNQMFGGSLTMNVTNTCPRRNYMIDEFAGVYDSYNVLSINNSPLALGSFCMFVIAFGLPFFLVAIDLLIALVKSCTGDQQGSDIFADDVAQFGGIALFTKNASEGIENLVGDGVDASGETNMAKGRSGPVNQIMIQAWIVVCSAIAVWLVAANFTAMSYTTTATYYHSYYGLFASFTIVFLVFAIFLSLVATIWYSADA